MPPILPADEFEALVHAHHAEVYRSARRIVRNDADALDVTQQVFVRVLEGKAATLEAEDRGRALRWLAARTALSHLRGASTRREKEEEAFVMERSEQEPESEATREEARVQLQRLLARLPDELRTALVLRFQEGWTFLQIAREQACSEPSAHDRVKRGLERLRGELSRIGFAGFAAGLPRELALDSGGPALALPDGLEHHLLGLRATTALSASAKLASGVLALATIISVATAAVLWPGGSKEEPAFAATTELSPPSTTEVSLPDSPAGRSAAAQASALRDLLQPGAGSAASSHKASSAIATGTLAGRCVDLNRVPIPSVSVFATSLQHDGKFARFSASEATGSDGRFAIEVPVSIEGGEEYVISTRHLDFVQHTREHVLAHEGVQESIGELTLLRSSHDEPGDSTLAVLVLDTAGAPVFGAIVDAFRNVLGTDGTVHEDSEASARTDASGRVTLNLKRLGAKRLYVLPPAGELGAASVAIGIDAPGRFERTVRLERGLTISGTIFGIGGLVRHGQGGFLAAFGDPNRPWIQADVDDKSGTFVLRGLEDRAYTLVRDGDEWSRVELRDVRAGTAGLAIQLKRQSDTRDLGDHQAELHGEVRDARTGEALALDAFTIRVEYPGELRGADWERDVLPTLIFPRPVQTALEGEYVPLTSFHVEGLAPGTYAVAARLKGYAVGFAGPFALGEHELRTGIVISVEPPAILRGVLVDPQGRPLANGFARVTGWGDRSLERDRIADAELRATRGRGAINVWDEVKTDEQGRFEILGLPGWSTLRLVVHHPEYGMAYSGALELHSGATTDVGRMSTGARHER